MPQTGNRRPLALGIAVFGAGAMLAASSALAWPTIKQYLTAPTVSTEHAPQLFAPVAAVRNPGSPAVSGFVAATRQAATPTGPEVLVRASVETGLLVDTHLSETMRVQETDVTAQETDTGYPDGMNEPPVAETPREIPDQAPFADSGDPVPTYINPTPRGPRLSSDGAAASNMMRGGPETLRAHRQMGTFR